MPYPPAYTAAEAAAGPYDNTGNPEAQMALAADMAARSQKPVVSVLGRSNYAAPTPDRIAFLQNAIKAGTMAALNNPTLATVRMGAPSQSWLMGYDLAMSIAAGHSLAGPNQNSTRDDIIFLYSHGPTEVADINAGFAVGSAMQYGMTKALQGQGGLISGNPSVAAGQLVVNGVAGNTGMTANQKAAAVGGVIATSSAAKAGAAGAVAAKTGFWAKFKAFFGM